MSGDNLPNIEELNFVKKLITDKMDSLNKDVNHCLQPPFAPMPAILWCFACLDLLAALLAGQALKFVPGSNERVNIKTNAQSYMRVYMDYNPLQLELIFEVFRHKLVHVSQPGPLTSYNDKTIMWMYFHESTPLHLKLLDFNIPEVRQIIPGLTERIDQIFILSISQFKQDIINSVFKPGGYLEKLETNPDIQSNCWRAIKDMHKPQEIK